MTSSHGGDGPGDALAVARSGPAEGTPLVLAHGFSQNAGAWGPFLAALATSRPLVAVDLPGHGGSSAVRADLPASARLLGEAGGPADYLGYSLGGRVALHLALSRPDLVRRLVLIGATAGIVDAAARQARREADDELARRLEAAAREDPVAARDEFLARWLRGPIFGTLAPQDAQLAARRANTAVGMASSLRLCGTGTQEALWDRLAGLAMPVLVVAGVLDVRFGGLGRHMVDAIGPNATLALVPGAGHACHLERPAGTARIVESFLA